MYIIFILVLAAHMLQDNCTYRITATRCCTLRRAKNTPTHSFVSRTVNRKSRCVVNLERGDTVQVTMPKPYIKYKIISSSRSWDICYESVNGRTNRRTDKVIAILQYFSYIVAVSFIGGVNRSTRRKPLTCRKSLTNFITQCCIKYTSSEWDSNSQC